jgi:hypothetical protein
MNADDLVPFQHLATRIIESPTSFTIGEIDVLLNTLAHRPGPIARLWTQSWPAVFLHSWVIKSIDSGYRRSGIRTRLDITDSVLHALREISMRNISPYDRRRVQKAIDRADAREKSLTVGLSQRLQRLCAAPLARYGLHIK